MTTSGFKLKYNISVATYDVLIANIITDLSALFLESLGNIFVLTPNITKGYFGEPAGVRSFDTYFWQETNLLVKKVAGGVSTVLSLDSDYFLKYDKNGAVNGVKLNQYIFRNEKLELTGTFGYSANPPKSFENLFYSLVSTILKNRLKSSGEVASGGQSVQEERSKHLTVIYRIESSMDKYAQEIANGNILGIPTIEKILIKYLQPDNLNIS